MNIALWVFAGGLAGWAGFQFIGANENSGMMVSMIIGMIGGFFGGNVLAPMFGGAVAACHFIGEMLARRFDI